MIEALTYFGLGLSMAATTLWVLYLWFGGVNYMWRCGLCGKLNEGNFLKFFLQWCNHQGDY